MRIAVVAPYLGSVLGNRGAFVLARALARANDVTLVTDVVSTGLASEIRSLLAPARLETITDRPVAPLSMGHLMWRQIVRRTDRTIARHLQQRHRADPFDAIFVRSDEGHWIGEYVRGWPADGRPVTLLGVLDLLDHPFLLRHERSHSDLRTLATIAYPWVHEMEARRLRAFDGLISNSRWTTSLLELLYGLHPLAEVDAYDDTRFVPAAVAHAAEPYLAVPTASLDSSARRWIERLAGDGLPLRLYGPKSVGHLASSGYLSDAAMAALIEAAAGTLFLFDYEAFGLIPVESLALGTPVVTLAKEGPFAEHRDNPHVTFVRSYDELVTACRALLASPKTEAVRLACQQSVGAYRPDVGAQRIVAAITALRQRRQTGR